MKNNRLSQEGGTNKISLVLLSLLVIAIFFIPAASAFQFCKYVPFVDCADTNNLTKIQDKDYIKSIRSGNSEKISGDFTKNYYSDDKRLKVEDKKEELVVDLKLLTPYENKISSSGNDPIALFQSINHSDDWGLFDKMDSYKINDEYKVKSKDYYYQYLVETEKTVCQEISQINNLTKKNETVKSCSNYIQKDWVEFKKAKDLPQGSVFGVFCDDLVEGEHVEVVYGIEGFDIYEWASYLVTDLVSYYKLDENAASTTVADSEGSNTGTASTNTANLYDASGKINSAFDFDGSSEYINVGTMGDWGGTIETSSISFWISTTDISSYVMGIINTGSYGSMISFLMNADGKIVFEIREEAASPIYSATSDSAINDGDWHHIVGTLDGTNTRIYVDGTINDTISSSVSSFDNFDYPYTIGARNNRGLIQSHFDGKLDEVGIWSRALNSTEVENLWADGDGFAYPFTFPLAPTLTNNATAPATVYTYTNWSVNLTATDPEESDINVWTQFYVDDVKTGGLYYYNLTNATNEQVAELGSGNFSSGNVLIAEVILGDGNTNSTAVNISDTVWINPIATDLVSYYKLDENAASTTVADSHGDNTGTASTNTANLYDASGKINSALDFESGNSDYVTIPNDATLNTNNLSISMWIKPESFGSNRGWIGKAGATPQFLLGETATAGGFQFHTTTATGGYSVIPLTTILSTATWYHIVMTYDGTTKRVYVDGTEDVTQATTSGVLTTATNPLNIGRDTSNTVYADGIMDEIGIWSRALNSTEVTYLWASGSPDEEQQYPFDPATDVTPVISITSPTQDTNYSYSNIYVNATADIAIANWSLDYNGTNYTFTPNTTFTFLDGEHDLKIYANSTNGNIGLNDSISFAVDATTPTIILNSPANGSTYNSSWDNIAINFSVSDTHLDSCSYNITNGTSFSTTCNTNISYLVQDGANTITYYATDTFGNIGAANLSIIGGKFVVEISNSTTTIQVIDGNSSWEEAANLTFNSSAPSTSWFSWLVDGVEKLAGIGENIFNWAFDLPSDAPNATVTLNVSIDNVTQSTENFTVITNSVDPGFNLVNVTTPIIYTVGDNVSVDFNASDINLEDCWYGYAGTNTTFSCISGVEKEVNVTSQSGYTSITFYANDTVSNEVSTVVNFTYDGAAPTVLATEPTGIQSFLAYENGVNLTLEYNITDANLDSCWYYYGEEKNLTGTIPTPYVFANYSFTYEDGGKNGLLITDYGGTEYYSLDNCTTNIVNASSNCTGMLSTTCINNFTCGVELIASITTATNAFWVTLNAITNVTQFDGSYNETLNCSESSINFTYAPVNDEVTVYGNDTLGNLGSATTNWSFILVEVNQTFEPVVYETDLETYKIDLKYDSSSWDSASVMLYYNGSNSTGVIMGAGDNIYGSSERNVPSVTVAGARDFYWTISLTNATGVYDFNSTTQTQNISRIGFRLCNYSENPQLFFQAFSTTDPEIPVNSTFASAWTMKNAAGGSDFLRSFEDTSGLNSSWGFCIVPNSSTYTISIDLTVDAANYTPTTHFIVDTNYSNVGENISLYLLHDDLSTLTQIKVTDQDNIAVEDVYVTIQRYDMGTDTYYNVAMARTDSSGEDLVYMSWYDDWYKFVGVYEGAVAFTDGPKKISSTPQTFKIGSIAELPYEKFGDILYGLTYNNATENFVLTYVDPSGQVSSNCLRVIKRNVTQDYTICETCETSSSATIYCNIGASGNGTFIADYYATGSPRYYIDALYIYNGADPTLYEMIGNDNGTGMAIIFAGIIMSMFLITPALGILGAMLGMIGGVALGFQPFDYGAMMGIILVGVAMMWAVQK